MSSTISPSDYNLPLSIDGFDLDKWGDYYGEQDGERYRVVPAGLQPGWMLQRHNPEKAGSSWEWTLATYAHLATPADAIKALRSGATR